MRELLESSGMPQPDEVEYGFGGIRLFFHATKTVVVVDIDEPADVDEAIDAEDCDDLDKAEAEEDRGPPFMTFPFPGREQRN